MIKVRLGDGSIVEARIQRADWRHLDGISRLILKTNISKRRLGSVSGYCFVRVQDKIIACAGLDAHNKEMVGLVSVAVEEEFRKQGIATAMIDYLIGRAEKRGFSLVGLVSMHYKIRFYKRRGFETCPRAELPINARSYHQFTSSYFKDVKHAVPMLRYI